MRNHIKPPLCPACGGLLRPLPADNATSRFVTDVYICSQCGITEALKGDFWFLKRCNTAPQLLSMSQAAWVHSYGHK